MTMRLDWKVLGSAMGCFLAISYMLCVSCDFFFGAQMYRAWVDLLPGLLPREGVEARVMTSQPPATIDGTRLLTTAGE
jgi:hypothetical protein